MLEVNPQKVGTERTRGLQTLTLCCMEAGGMAGHFTGELDFCAADENRRVTSTDSKAGQVQREPQEAGSESWWILGLEQKEDMEGLGRISFLRTPITCIFTDPF